MELNFNLWLCNRNIQLKNESNKILDTSFFRIRDKIAEALNKEVTFLKRKRIENHTSIKNYTKNYKIIKKTVAQKVVFLEQKMR